MPLEDLVRSAIDRFNEPSQSPETRVDGRGDDVPTRACFILDSIATGESAILTIGEIYYRSDRRTDAEPTHREGCSLLWELDEGNVVDVRAYASRSEAVAAFQRRSSIGFAE